MGIVISMTVTLLCLELLSSWSTFALATFNLLLVLTDHYYRVIPINLYCFIFSSTSTSMRVQCQRSVRSVEAFHIKLSVNIPG